MSSLTEAVPAASAVLVRDAPEGLEALLLRRTAKASFAPGVWVFPGGRVDPGDFAGGPFTDTEVDGESSTEGSLAEGRRSAGPLVEELAAARRAAARETAEEAGLKIDGARLLPLSHWVPPSTAPRRFRTWILVGEAPEGDVVVDGGEITDYRWTRPADALRARDAGDLELLPPTWVMLWTLTAHTSVASVLSAAAAGEPERFETHIARVPGGYASMWHGDAGYEDCDPTASGARHRLWMVEAGWRYERTTNERTTNGRTPAPA